MMQAVHLKVKERPFRVGLTAVVTSPCLNMMEATILSCEFFLTVRVMVAL